MQKQNSIEFGDNYKKFVNFRAVQPDRELRLSKSIASQSKLAPFYNQVTMLDIGSSDGKIIPYIINELLSMYANLSFDVVAIEPDPYPFQILKNLNLSEKVNFNAKHINFMDFLESVKSTCNKFDLVIGTHILYHFSEWEKLIQDIINVINTNGKLILTIDSKQSPIYYRKDDIARLMKDSDLVNFYGQYCFAEDLECLLRKCSLEFTKQHISSFLEIKQSEDINECQLAESISFLHRVDIKLLCEKENVRSLFEDFVIQKGEITFYKIPWEEVIFTINK